MNGAFGRVCGRRKAGAVVLLGVPRMRSRRSTAKRNGRRRASWVCRAAHRPPVSHRLQERQDFELRRFGVTSEGQQRIDPELERQGRLDKRTLAERYGGRAWDGGLEAPTPSRSGGRAEGKSGGKSGGLGPGTRQGFGTGRLGSRRESRRGGSRGDWGGGSGAWGQDWGRSEWGAWGRDWDEAGAGGWTGEWEGARPSRTEDHEGWGSAWQGHYGGRSGGRRRSGPRGGRRGRGRGVWDGGAGSWGSGGDGARAQRGGGFGTQSQEVGMCVCARGGGISTQSTVIYVHLFW